MIEKVLQAGADRSLRGILCEPLEGSQNTAVLFWNSGLLHHVGPNRLYVRMARALCSVGIPSFRFDVSGLGDSAKRSGAASEGARAVGEIREVMDYLERSRGIKNFILVGLCSGSDEAHRVSVVDSRVAAVVHLDGYAERTLRFFLRFVAVRILSPRKWKRLVQIVFSRLLAPVRALMGPGKVRARSVEIFERDFPSRTEIRSELGALVGRGTSLLYLYTGGQTEYGYPNQFRDMFKGVDLKNLVEFGFYPGADHLYSNPGERRVLIERVVTWIRDRANLL